MQKPYKITELQTPQDTERLDNLLTILFDRAQEKEFRYLEFTGTGVWPGNKLIEEKELVLVRNTADNVVRLYTKVAGILKYLQWT